MHTHSVDDPSLVRLDLCGRAVPATRIAAVLWAAGWLVTEAAALSQGFRHGWSPGAVVWLAMWTATGAVVLLAIAWAAAGRPETVTVSGRGLQLRRGIGPFGRTLRFDGSVVRALRAAPPRHGLLADYAAIRAFWDRGAGRIAFDAGGRTFAFGQSLDDAAVDRVCAAIASRLPSSIIEPEDAEPDTPRARRRRPGWAAHAAGWMIVGALAVPVRMLLIDLPICTGGAGGGEYEPIDPAALHGEGRVVLVPFGDFSTDTAREIADWFRDKYGLDIVAGGPVALPDDAIDLTRGQADSGVLLAALAARYPDAGTPIVAIGLTSADLFIREANWKYAFSNRRPPRFAVVSPARMDRGCMGLRPASEATRLARLRKMVGKNIGVLFYRLPPSAHPRSLMYAWIGGPQELDTMREEF